MLTLDVNSHDYSSDMFLIRDCTFFIFFYNHTATTEIYTLSLHDALPIFNAKGALTYTDIAGDPVLYGNLPYKTGDRKSGSAGMPRPISYAVFCLKKKTRGSDQTCPET